MSRPSFIINTKNVAEVAGQYPDSEELLSYGRAIGKAAGLLKIGLHVERLEPGHRLSYPHAESLEEEFVLVLEGRVDAWIDGETHLMEEGDLAAFPAGTGICHTFINNGSETATLLAGGESSKPNNQIHYPRNPERKSQMAVGDWWEEIPQRVQGAHDGVPSTAIPKPLVQQSLVHVALVVRDYDEAIDFFTQKLHFELIEDSYQPEQDKRWVVVAPPNSQGTNLLLARATSPAQEAAIGNQTGGRVFMFLNSNDFWRDYNQMVELGIEFEREPKKAPYGMVAVFKDLYGNLWDLLELL